MAINKNHEFEELNGIKCAIVAKNASKERVAFLNQLLSFNQYTVVVVPSPPPKTTPVPVPKPVAPGEDIQAMDSAVPPPVAPIPVVPETFTVGVTDVTFNPINAIFGRLLKAPGGHIVTLAYWHQEENVSHDEIPYYEEK